MPDYVARKVILKDPQGRYIVPFTGAVESVNGVKPDDTGNVVVSVSWESLPDKPTIPAAQVNADWNASSGVSAILNKPTIPAAQVQTDWNATSGIASIKNKPALNFLPITGGTASGVIYAPGFQISSDIRLKSKLEGIKDAQEKVANLSGYIYDMKGFDYRRAGLIAQDVASVLPEAVMENGDGYLTIDYGAVVALLVEAIKSLDNKFKLLETMNGVRL